MIRNILLIILALVSGSSQAQMGGWINTGPVNFPENVSGQIHGIGRVSQIKFHASNPQKMYAVSASGGLFITTNNGVNWAPAPGTDQLPATSCSAVCIDQTNDNIIYLSLGDADYYSNHFGIFKSTDGGSTWNPSNTGIGNAMAVEILMDPSNTNILVAATSSGIWRSTNAGASWIQELPGAFRDMKQRPGSTTDLYAVTASSFFRSTDFGNTWTSVTSGVSVPAGNGGMRIAVSNANPSIVYLATTSGNGRILKSLNSGVSFSTVYSSNTQCLVCYEGSPASGSQGNYNIDINANPQNAEELLLVAHTVWGSVDGGVTWSQRTDWWAEVHTDMHQIEFNPHNNSQIFNANDGGVWLSTDPQAAAWSPRSDGIAASEVYHAAQSPVLRQMVSIGTQDNGELYFPGSWKTNRGGDWNMKCAIDYTSGAQVYYLGSGDRRMLAPHSGEQSYNPPFAPTNNACMAFVRGLTGTGFLGVDSLFRSTNLGNAVPSWSLIWPSTARIRDIHSSRSDSNVLYVVTNNNNLFRSDNALSSSPVFTQLSTPGSSFLTASITTNRYNANMVYLSCGSQVYLSSNKGQTWTNISGNLPGLNIRKIIHDEYTMTERLFVNPGSYVYYKDGGNTGWTNHPGLPTVANVTDFMIYNDGSAASVLRLSSYGRGVWECDINNHLPPAPEFYADREMICPGDTVRFYKTVYGAANSVAWSFPGGTPSTSSLDTPIIVFNSVGTYDVSLTASGPGGNGVKHKAGYIIVTNGQSTAVQEGFQGLPFLPQHWQLISQSGVNWVQSWLAGGFGLSTRSAVFRNYSNDTEGDHDRLVCPQVDLSGISNARLLFDVAYAPFSAANPDSLIVSVSTDCGQSFTPVYVKSGTSLATAPALTTAGILVISARICTSTMSIYKCRLSPPSLPWIAQSVREIPCFLLTSHPMHHSGTGPWPVVALQPQQWSIQLPSTMRPALTIHHCQYPTALEARPN
ncbi:MAG: PKD domain-containing protein [Sphingobacteriales bacterium]|nr:MAG: PKD domain-containing protein [Sphingobacteriales bacterium]